MNIWAEYWMGAAYLQVNPVRKVFGIAKSFKAMAMMPIEHAE